jgi:3-phenylpropionate/trans-cinnamate dioxygenase ferredoxin subunit
MTTYDIGTLEDYVHGEAAQVKVHDHVLVVVRIENDVYVLDDRCSHEDFSLSLGEVDVDTCEIECARHGAMFHLKDGQPASFPATRPVAHYDVVVEVGRLRVVMS